MPLEVHTTYGKATAGRLHLIFGNTLHEVPKTTGGGPEESSEIGKKLRLCGLQEEMYPAFSSLQMRRKGQTWEHKNKTNRKGIICSLCQWRIGHLIELNCIQNRLKSRFSVGRGNFSVGMKQLINTDYVVRLHLTFYFQRPLEEARQISTRNDKDVFLAGLGERN